jgi:hypothetical protein
LSLSQQLSEGTLTHLLDITGATEVHGPDGGNLLVAAGEPGQPTGTMRVFTGGTERQLPVQKIVWTMLQVPARGVTTCMIFAFSDPSTGIPHFTLDCSDHGNGGYAFHLDLLPRVDLATHVPYMDEVFGPLTPLYDAGRSLPGLSATRTTRRQYAMMSPWMLVNLADETAFHAIGGTVRAYADHWHTLVEHGLSDDVTSSLADTDLAARDARVRLNLFSPEIDPVWGRVDSMIGPEAALVMRSQLQQP